MARGYRRFSPADEDEIWARLRAGHAAKPTARALGWSTSGVRGYLVRCGGIRPAPRRTLTAVMDRMGHAQITTTQKYLHALPDADSKNLTVLDRIRRSEPGPPPAPAQ